MRILKIRVSTENPEGEKFNGEFTAYELRPRKDEEYYGNGIHIHIVYNSRTWKYIDARYIKGYDFEKIVRNELEYFYGDNLKEIEITKE